jgi:hypothetical protein
MAWRFVEDQKCRNIQVHCRGGGIDGGDDVDGLLSRDVNFDRLEFNLHVLFYFNGEIPRSTHF